MACCQLTCDFFLRHGFPFFLQGSSQCIEELTRKVQARIHLLSMSQIGSIGFKCKWQVSHSNRTVSTSSKNLSILCAICGCTLSYTNKNQHPQMACQARCNLEECPDVLRIQWSIQAVRVKKMKICAHIMWNVAPDLNGTTKEIGPLNKITLYISLTMVSPYTYMSIPSCGRKSRLFHEDPPLILFLLLHTITSEGQTWSLVFHGKYWGLCWFKTLINR